jgi:hypothetical protein
MRPRAVAEPRVPPGAVDELGGPPPRRRAAAAGGGARAAQPFCLSSRALIKTTVYYVLLDPGENVC